MVAHKPYLVDSFQHLKSKPRSDEALVMLQKIASLVKPIMKAHDWNLPILAEFFPSNPGLLGMNMGGGQKILIRLRPAHDESKFLEMEDLIGTMLHELTHNVHGPHDAAFYAFLKKLEDEFDELQRKGYTGDGFLSNGSRVGVGIAHDVPEWQRKQKQLEAAEERFKKQRLMGPGGRLGGGPSGVDMRPMRERLAAAAERRAKDDATCPTTDEISRNEEVRKAAQDSIQTDAKEMVNNIMDLTMDSSDEEEKHRGDNKPKGSSAPNTSTTTTKSTVLTESTISQTSSPKLPATHKSPASVSTASRPTPAPALHVPSHSLTKSSLLSDHPTWSCPTCTLLSPLSTASCPLCSTPRPEAFTLILAAEEDQKRAEWIARTKGNWVCEACGKFEEAGHWTCWGCGRMKSSS